jgi:hypothetical protein
MTKSAEVEINLTADDGVLLPILLGTTKGQSLHSIPDPKEETLPSTPQPATEDTLMAGTLQSTPEAAAGGEPFPISTPELSLNLLDGSTLPAYQPSKADNDGDTELNFDSTSSDEKGRVEIVNEPSEENMSDGVAAAESNSLEPCPLHQTNSLLLEEYLLRALLSINLSPSSGKCQRQSTPQV